MAIVVAGIDHVVLRVADIDRSIQFYCDVLGCREERRVERIGLIQLRAGRAMIDLIDGSRVKGGWVPTGSATGNMDHFALRLERFDEGAIRTHLETHGVEPGAVHQRYGAEGEGPSMYIEDPDGNTVELKGPPTR